MPEPTTQAAEAREATLARDFASAFVRIRGAHNPAPGEPCAWCRLAGEQAAEAVMTTVIRNRIERAAVAQALTPVRRRR